MIPLDFPNFGKHEEPLKLGEDKVQRMVFYGKDFVAAGTRKGSILLISLKTQKVTKRWQAHDTKIGILYALGERLITSCVDSTRVKVWRKSKLQKEILCGHFLLSPRGDTSFSRSVCGCCCRRFAERNSFDPSARPPQVTTGFLHQNGDYFPQNFGAT